MYIGRFAPSPTGALHFGSLLAALASYLDARHHHGQWLLRIEDIDPLRAVTAEQHRIPETLSAFGLFWDGDISYQHRHDQRYSDALHQLQTQQNTYYCTCSRKAIAQRNNRLGYDRFCRSQHNLQGAIRFKVPDAMLTWSDQIQGTQTYPAQTIEDFLLRRRDALWAYQLAVVVDDAYAGVTHVVRGYDLIHETAKQWILQNALHYPHPTYAHIPVITTHTGQKLSKQSYATPLTCDNITAQLFAALTCLGQNPPQTLYRSPSSVLLEWAIEHWSLAHIPQQNSLLLPQV